MQHELQEIRDYFENIADADHNGAEFVGNEEMKLMMLCDKIKSRYDELENIAMGMAHALASESAIRGYEYEALTNYKEWKERK